MLRIAAGNGRENAPDMTLVSKPAFDRDVDDQQ
jgi:hypothetical protein